MLRFADELLLLLIDDKRGDLIPIPEWSLGCALAGTLLMDLAQEGRIDTDPDLLRRTRAEADELFAQGMPTPQGIQQLGVIKRAYLETLRLHSTVPLTIRTVANYFEFAGCTVPAGHPVVLQFTLPHHMPAYFPNPERFDIARFAPPRNEHQQPGVYMPSGVGTHRCLGSHLAELTTTTAMTTLLHDAELELVPPDYVLTQRKIKRIPTRHPDKSLKFRLVRRRLTSTAPSPTTTAGE